jgi:hypothetical protein
MKEITQSDRAKLDELNAAVSGAVQARRQWLDSKMAEYADVPVGERLFDLDSGLCVGIVTRHFRFWSDRNDGVRDDTLTVDYEYRTNGGHVQDTANQLERRFGKQ